MLKTGLSATLRIARAGVMTGRREIDAQAPYSAWARVDVFLRGAGSSKRGSSSTLSRVRHRADRRLLQPGHRSRGVRHGRKRRLVDGRLNFRSNVVGFPDIERTNRVDLDDHDHRRGRRVVEFDLDHRGHAGRR